MNDEMYHSWCGKRGNIMDKEKIRLNFTDEIGYTEFMVNKKWYEQQNETDTGKIYHLACDDNNSELTDCTGKYVERCLSLDNWRNE